MHRRRLILTITFVLFLSTPVAGADEAVGQAVRFRTGVGLTQAREDAIVGLPFVGPSLDLGARYACERPRWVFNAALDLGTNLLLDRFGTVTLMFTPDLRLDILADAFGVRGLRLGGGLDIVEVLGNYHGWDDSHLHWATHTSPTVAASWATRLGSRELDLALRLPVVSWVSRPPLDRLYKSDPLVYPSFWLTRWADQPRFTTWAETQAAALQATWRSRRGGFRMDPYFESTFFHHSRPADVTAITTSLGLVMSWDR